MLRRSALLAVVAVAVSLTAVGCADRPESGGSDTYVSVNGGHPIDVGAPINPYSGRSNAFQGYNAMQLAWPRNNLTDVDAFYPAIAQSWDIDPGGAAVTVRLHPRARWSDGTPVTARDVRTSAAVAITQSGSAAGRAPRTSGMLGEVTVVNDRTVRFAAVPGLASNTFARSVLQLYVLPDAVFGPHLPANFWQLAAASRATDAARVAGRGTDAARVAGRATDPVRALAAGRAREQLTALGRKLAGVGPAKDLSCGPFVLQHVNAGQALLVRNPHFYAVERIAAAKVKLVHHADNRALWDRLVAGELDSAPSAAIPTNVVAKILRTPGSRRITGPAQSGAALAFNQSFAPFDQPDVRRAIAHVVDRLAVQRAGQPESGRAAEHTTGLIRDAAKAWLGGGELAGLSRYPQDRNRAERLLIRAGMARTDGGWLRADGRPFAFTIHVPRLSSDLVAAARSIGRQLTAFGIPAEVRTSADAATYQAELAAGKYPAVIWQMGHGPSTYDAYARLYGAANGWSDVAGRLTHHPPKTAGNWIGAPQTAIVPGLGAVDPGATTRQLARLSTAGQKQAVATLARFTNDQLPVLQLWDYVDVHFVNETRFTGFPPDNCECLGLSHGVWMQLGYIRGR